MDLPRGKLALVREYQTQSSRSPILHDIHPQGVLRKLKDKATTIYQQFAAANPDGEMIPSPTMMDDIEDNLAIFVV